MVVICGSVTILGEMDQFSSSSTPSHDMENYPREKQDSLSEIVMEVDTLPTGATDHEHDYEEPEQSGMF